MSRKIIYTTILTAVAAICTTAQTPVPSPVASPSPVIESGPVGLKTVLNEAVKQISNYQTTFKDLLATETKTFETYNKRGELKDSTTVESIFLVYQSAQDKNVTSELRSVLKVDEKPVPDSQERSDRLLAELQKATSAGSELDKIEKEGLRYDPSLRVIGFTLYEGIALAENLRPFFEFTLAGTENYEGSEAYVVNYQQTKKSPYITVNEKPVESKGGNADFDADIPGELKNNDKFMRGKLWIDKNTFQIRREERELTVKTNAETLVALRTVFEYAPSDFGILVPKKISLLENSIKKASKKSDNFAAVKNTAVSFDYSKFRKTNVEVQIEDN